MQVRTVGNMIKEAGFGLIVPRLAGAAIAIAGIVVTAPVASAQAGPGVNVISACYIPTAGTIYRIMTPTTPAECRKGHIAFSWDSTSAGDGPAPTEAPITLHAAYTAGASYGPVKATKIGRVVYLSGTADPNGANGPAGTLPLGYRPAYLLFLPLASSTVRPAWIMIEPNGEITCASGEYISCFFGGLSFLAAP